MIPFSSNFGRLANSWVRPLSWRVGMAWDKTRREDVSWGVYDQSFYDGADLYAADYATLPPFQIWDTYNFNDISERVTSVTVSRSVDFPFTVQSAICDIGLANHDDYFTPFSRSPIAEFIRPSIPIRAWLGFGGENLPQFVGLTEGMPDVDINNGEASITAFDFLSWALDQPFPSMSPMVDARTDAILSAIFIGIGLAPGQFNFQGSTNRVPVFFPARGSSIKSTVKKLVQAENGRLWQDENGIIRFAGRNMNIPRQVDIEYDDDSVSSLKMSQDAGVINRVIIKTPIREIQQFQPVSEKSAGAEVWGIPSGGSIFRTMTLNDPCVEIITPTIGVGATSWFTVKTPDGAPVGSGVTCTLFLRPESAELLFESSLAFPVEIDEVFLWGRPAIVIDNLEYEAFGDTWADDFDFTISITDNEYFGDVNNARAFSESIFLAYDSYNPIIEVEVKGTTALQLNDAVHLNTTRVVGDYQVAGIKQTLANNRLNTSLTLKKFTLFDFAIYDVSIYDGDQVYGF